MVNHTRLDCVLGTAAAMRAAVEQATHHAAYRSAFGSLLVDQPLMRNVLADLCIESEAATLTGLRLARAYDRGEIAFARVATAVAKYWVCKRGPGHAAEALECLGGNGYVEESILPRLYREAPVNAIWEGSGNVMCLDVLRALRRDEEAAEFFANLARKSAPLVGAASDVFAPMNDFESEAKARITVGKLATLAAASALEATAPPAVTEAFVHTRLHRQHAALYGADDIEAHTADTLLQRALPEG
jgi:putative acyl-CoA dehydrogenase